MVLSRGLACCGIRLDFLGHGKPWLSENLVSRARRGLTIIFWVIFLVILLVLDRFVLGTRGEELGEGAFWGTPGKRLTTTALMHSVESGSGPSSKIEATTFSK